MKKNFVIGIIVIVVAVGVFVGISVSKHSNRKNKPSESSQQNNQNHGTQSDSNSSDPVTKGQALSGGMCTGKGSKKLTTAPMKSSDIGVIIPMGNMVGAHVTPIDHEYYYQKNPSAPRDTYDVYAPADGKIVSIQHRTEFVGNRSGAPSSQTDEYRIVISYSCTFFSYYDLTTSLDPSVMSKLPSDFAKTGNMGRTPIAIKAGQVIAHVGGQSLDFAVWDTTKQAKGLLVPIAFNNAEAWKINTVTPLDYFSSDAAKEILPFYIRKDKPLDGTFAYDVDGKAIGDWFLQGTNGYAGSDNPQGGASYWKGHLALAPDAIDPLSKIFSVGQFNGGDATQFVITGTDPAHVSQSSGIVKYQLSQFNYVDSTGKTWNGSIMDTGVTAHPGNPQATALIELTGARTMKVEVFPGKTPDQVSGFDSGVQIYNRGQDAKMVSTNGS